MLAVLIRVLRYQNKSKEAQRTTLRQWVELTGHGAQGKQRQIAGQYPYEWYWLEASKGQGEEDKERARARRNGVGQDEAQPGELAMRRAGGRRRTAA